MVAVQPETQIVLPMSAWVTAGFVAPGVSFGSGSPGRRTDRPGVNVTVGFAVGGAVTFAAIALGPGCFTPDFGVEAAVTGLGFAAAVGTDVVSAAADAGVELAPVVAGVAAVPAQPATAMKIRLARAHRCARPTRAMW
jgi:hypothetical protein